ncbi:hypothetical protein EN870_07605 [bacterium M00.F.Ca.ET.227.01.1.1]|nr:hypothetical protein EN870_07605 [bacterium M00.F.Ca.ET.227.01.1.1]TGU38900.1 hypothetical protein EN799_09360 [bacterium M00.F.Ca.ET.156.01.1.1]
MQVETLFSQFEKLASGQDSIQKLRELALQIALAGQFSRAIEPESKWQHRRLSEIATIFSGNSVASSEKAARYEGLEEGYPYIATKDVEGWNGQIIYDNNVRIPFNEKGFKYAKSGSVLICAEGGSAGKKIGVVDRDVCFGNKLICCDPVRELVRQKYLLRLFQSNEFRKSFEEEMTGIIGGIALSKFKQLTVRIPSLECQDEIIRKLDALFVLCDELECRQTSERALKGSLVSALATKIITEQVEQIGALWPEIDRGFESLIDEPSTIQRLRDCLIQLAISGRYGEGSHVDELVLDAIDTRTRKMIALGPAASNETAPFQIPVNWQWRVLSDLVNPSKPISYGVIKLGPDHADGIPVLRCSDVRFREIDETAVKRISPDIESDYRRTRLAGGEVLVNIRGTLGGCAVVPPSLSGYNVAREVAVIDPNSLVSAEYLLAVLSSPYFQDEVNSNLKGIAYRGLNLGTLANFLIPVPPKMVQQDVVEIVEKVMALCTQLERQVRDSSRISDEFWASLINSFTTDPDGGGTGSEVVEYDTATDQNRQPTDTQATAQDKARVDRSVSGLDKGSTIGSLITGGDKRFKEAVLVYAIVAAFFREGGEPIGNFRLQKAVYFARRHSGEHALNRDFARKAAGPYNPAMKYTGGIAIAKQKSWLHEAKGRYGFGHIPGSAAAEVEEWAARFGYEETARWVSDQFRFKKNDDWEVLATVDYSMEHLRSEGIEPHPDTVLQYIRADDEWRHKIEKLRLTETKIQSTMIELAALFGV